MPGNIFVHCVVIQDFQVKMGVGIWIGRLKKAIRVVNKFVYFTVGGKKAASVRTWETKFNNSDLWPTCKCIKTYQFAAFILVLLCFLLLFAWFGNLGEAWQNVLPNPSVQLQKNQ